MSPRLPTYRLACPFASSLWADEAIDTCQIPLILSQDSLSDLRLASSAQQWTGTASGHFVRGWLLADSTDVRGICVRWAACRLGRFVRIGPLMHISGEVVLQHGDGLKMSVRDQQVRRTAFEYPKRWFFGACHFSHTFDGTTSRWSAAYGYLARGGVPHLSAIDVRVAWRNLVV